MSRIILFLPTAYSLQPSPHFLYHPPPSRAPPWRAALFQRHFEVLMQHPMLNIGIRAARRAGDLIMRSMNRVHQLEVRSKDVNDFVTEVDLRAEQDIIDTIRMSFPDHGILAEESGRNGTGNLNADHNDEFV